MNHMVKLVGRSVGARRRLSALATALVCLALGACAIGPQAVPAPDSYDLGPPRAHTPQAPLIRATLALPGITPPAWLDHQGIIYRLSYQDAARPQAYAHSRWSAPPAQLLTQRARSRFAAASTGVVPGEDGTRADYVLRIELEDFSQSFDAVKQSRVSARARATLVRLADRTLLAQRTFAVVREAEPDAPGAVRALAEAADAMIEEMLAWIAERLKSGRP
jgi:cholesterol transport system auxiliary component